ncbi:hypothetical protein M9H77_37265 [Catharanthus roseus]|uniref:Uncharacterized protein n=1 Tax=Catharanthus roseus TaxID=4058 RepID=A0ACB9ZUJ4_CATRO|nr:hypothetical protein M9H77_37265 [Catharanthus roseus]
MGRILELNSYGLLTSSLSSSSSSSSTFNNNKNYILDHLHIPKSSATASSSLKFIRGSTKYLSLRGKKIRALGTIPDQSDQSETTTSSSSLQEEPPHVNFAFVSSVLLPDGNMDVRCRTATGGQKLRDIMLDANVELYGPYARPLLNCAGGGICGTCIVEVVQGKELLGPRTEIEKEKLKKNPKNWRLACQITVGKPDSRGLVIIQQLPEWKLHEWNYGEPPPLDEEQEEEKDV